MFSLIKSFFTKRHISDVTLQSNPTSSTTELHSTPSSVVGEVRVKPRDVLYRPPMPPRGRRSTPTNERSTPTDPVRRTDDDLTPLLLSTTLLNGSDDIRSSHNHEPCHISSSESYSSNDSSDSSSCSSSD